MCYLPSMGRNGGAAKALPWLIGVAVTAFFGLATWRMIVNLREVSGRTRYVFINQTPDHERDLAEEQLLKTVEKRAGVENALIRLPELPEGRTLAEIAAQLFTHWRIGKLRNGRGILYLYTCRENLLRIEPSADLRAALPPALLRELEGAARTFALAESEPEFLTELVTAINDRIRANGPNDASLPPGSFFPAGPFARLPESPAPGSNRSEPLPSLRADDQNLEFAPASTPEETVARYQKSQAAGRGEPGLPLLTEGSRFFRWAEPAPLARLLRNGARAAPAGSTRVFTQGDLAYAVFAPHSGLSPLVLRKDAQAHWRVDESRSRVYFQRFEEGGEPFPKFGDLPLLAELRAAGVPYADQPVYRDWTRTPPPRSGDLREELTRAEARFRTHPDDADVAASLGELYFFETGWLSRAERGMARAVALRPDRLDWHWRLFDIYRQQSRVARALHELETLARLAPRDIYIREWNRRYRKEYEIKPGEFPDTRLLRLAQTDLPDRD